MASHVRGRWPLSHGVGVSYNIGLEDTFEWEKQHIAVVVVVVVVVVLLLL